MSHPRYTKKKPASNCIEYFRAEIQTKLHRDRITSGSICFVEKQLAMAKGEDSVQDEIQTTNYLNADYVLCRITCVYKVQGQRWIADANGNGDNQKHHKLRS